MSRELWPANVARLTELGVEFTHRPAEHDIKTACPKCDNVLILHETEPWHYCGHPTCPAWMLGFEDIVKAISAEMVAK